MSCKDQRIMVDRKQWKKLLNRVKCLERDNESLKKRVKNINKRLHTRRQRIDLF